MDMMVKDQNTHLAELNVTFSSAIKMKSFLKTLRLTILKKF